MGRNEWIALGFSSGFLAGWFATTMVISVINRDSNFPIYALSTAIASIMFGLSLQAVRRIAKRKEHV